MALMKWAFHTLPQPMGFTWKSLYESWSPTPLKGCVAQRAVHPRCSRAMPPSDRGPDKLQETLSDASGMQEILLAASAPPQTPL